jgi:hypothetical protein
MNAFELADELRKMFQGEEYDRLIHEIPDVLRQQADRIADLETAVTFLRKALDDTLDALSSSIEFTKAIQERSRNEN